jgi:hypothetical protein
VRARHNSCRPKCGVPLRRVRAPFRDFFDNAKFHSPLCIPVRGTRLHSTADDKIAKEDALCMRLVLFYAQLRVEHLTSSAYMAECVSLHVGGDQREAAAAAPCATRHS